MRLKSEFFVAALTRRVFSDGGFAAVVRRGAEAAGAIFLVSRARDGTIALFGPAMQTHYAEDMGRRFMRETLADDAALEKRFAAEARFDPDFWVVEIETDEPGRYFDMVDPD